MASQSEENNTEESKDPKLIVAYLSYALEDVRAFSDVGAFLLRLAIAALSEERPPVARGDLPRPVMRH